ILGIPAVAVSFVGAQPRDIEKYQPMLSRLLGQIVERGPFPPETQLNINLPDIDPADVQGVQVTRLARRVYTDSITRSRDPSGREYFWIGGGGVEWRADEGTDFHAVQAGYISVTPLHLDLTNYRLLSAVSEWGLHP